MKFWRSVVGKLWFTILMLVSFVLLVLTILLLKFFETYHVDEVEKNLTKLATRVSHVMETNEDEALGRSISWQIVEESMKVMIVSDENHYWYSPGEKELRNISLQEVHKDHQLDAVFTKSEVVSKTMLTTDETPMKILIVGVPFVKDGNKGAVYLYQSLKVIEETTNTTKKYILLAAFIAIILTTIFAFFLSTRITAPLRTMREAAFQLAKGNFEAKVPALTQDEIGELGTAFNQMARQLKYNMNALNQEKEQLTSILSSMADGVITFSREGSVLVTNPPAEKFIRSWHFEQGLQMDVLNKVPHEVTLMFNRVVQLEQEQVIEVTIQGRNWVVLMSPLYNQTYIRGAVAVLRDMTQERRLDKLRQDFIANVSHELRTPIAMLQGYSEALLDDIAQSEEERKEMASVINEESLRMGRLVNELLDLARMEAGHITLNYEECELVPYAERIIRKFQGLARDKQIQLISCLDIETTAIYIDVDRIEQVLTNLIDNAIRHTGEAGQVVLNVKETATSFTFDVQDSGSGIPEDDLPFVFERFYKADKARTRGRSGTGLGLSIAKNIVLAHDGEIAVHSKLGEGTKFSFIIPKK